MGVHVENALGSRNRDGEPGRQPLTLQPGPPARTFLVIPAAGPWQDMASSPPGKKKVTPNPRASAGTPLPKLRWRAPRSPAPAPASRGPRPWDPETRLQRTSSPEAHSGAEGRGAGCDELRAESAGREATQRSAQQDTLTAPAPGTRPFWPEPYCGRRPARLPSASRVRTHRSDDCPMPYG